jgi:hypothetical protein
MRVRRADKNRIGLPRQDHVVLKPPPSGQEPLILEPTQGLTDAEFDHSVAAIRENSE